MMVTIILIELTVFKSSGYKRDGEWEEIKGKKKPLEWQDQWEIEQKKLVIYIETGFKGVGSVSVRLLVTVTIIEDN